MSSSIIPIPLDASVIEIPKRKRQVSRGHSWHLTSFIYSSSVDTPIKLVSTVQNVTERARSELRRQGETTLISTKKKRTPPAKGQSNIAVIGQAGSGQSKSIYTPTSGTYKGSQPVIPNTKKLVECAKNRKRIKGRIHKHTALK